MTETFTPTVLTTLEGCSPTQLADALRLLGFGKFFENLSAPKTKAGTIPGTPFQITLDNTPISGTVRIVASSTGVLTEKITGSPGSGQFSVNGRTITFNTAQAAQTYSLEYASCDAGEDGVTTLADAIAQEIGTGT